MSIKCLNLLFFFLINHEVIGRGFVFPYLWCYCYHLYFTDKGDNRHVQKDLSSDLCQTSRGWDKKTWKQLLLIGIKGVQTLNSNIHFSIKHTHICSNKSSSSRKQTDPCRTDVLRQMGWITLYRNVDRDISGDKSGSLVLNGKGPHICFRSKRYQNLTVKKGTLGSLL